MVGVGLPLRLVLGFALCGSAGIEKPLPAPIPAVLQAANTQASWEDRDIDFWVRSKVDGFLLSEAGRSTSGAGQPPEDGGLAALAGRLRQAGIRKNGLVVPLPTRQSPYLSTETAPPFIAKARSAAVRAFEAGMWGIALDTRGTGAIHAFTWSGYADESVSRDDLRANARRVGTALGRAFTQDARAELVLVLAEELENAGPLWFPLFEGILQGIENSPASLGLVICPSGQDSAARALCADTAKWLHVRLSPETLRVWQRVGTIECGVPLASVSASSSEPAAMLPEGGPEGLKQRLIDGKLNASRFVVNTAEVPAQWRSPDSDAPAVDFSTPLDTFTRVGRLTVAGEETDVLRNADGAALVFPSGIPDRISIPMQASPVLVTALVSGTVTKLPADQAAVELDPTNAPTMVAGLPIRTWAAPAGLWFSASPLPAGQARIADISYGWVNRTGLSMTGVLETSCPGRFAITPSGLSLSTADGESVSVAGRISGPFGAAPAFSVRLVVAAPHGDPIVREVPLKFPPPLRWATKMDGPIATPPAVADLDGDGQPEVYAASTAGDVASFSSNGALRWRWESPAPVSTSPVAFRHWSGTPLVAVLDNSGWLHCYKPDGMLRFEVDLAAPVMNGAMYTANLHGFPGQELVCVLANGEIRALLSNGQDWWKVDTQTGIAGLAIVAGSHKRDTVIATLDDATCIAIAADGTRLWKTDLPGPPVSSPVLEVESDSPQRLVLVGLKDGAILRIALSDGSIVDARQVPNKIVPRRIVPVGQLPGEREQLLIADGTSLTCLGGDMKTHWTVEVPNDGYPQPIGGKHGTIVLLPARQGEIWAIDSTGAVLWKETRSAGSVAGVLTPLITADRPAWIYASQDGFLRAIDIPH